MAAGSLFAAINLPCEAQVSLSFLVPTISIPQTRKFSQLSAPLESAHGDNGLNQEDVCSSVGSWPGGEEHVRVLHGVQ